jgi:hypothetical protein
MRKSRTVSLSFVSALAGAALAAGCGSRPAQQQGWQTCVDRQTNTAVDTGNCDQEPYQPHPYGYVPHYHWYYYPRGYYWDAPRMGMPVPSGGTFGTRSFGSVPMARTGVVRGGFGSTASGHASSSGHASGGE